MPPRDLSGYGRRPPHPQWPNGARVALQFVLNVEEGAESTTVNLNRVVEPVRRWFSTACPPPTTAPVGYPGAGKSAGGSSCRPWRYFTSA